MNMKGNSHSFKVYAHYLKAAKLKQFDSDLFLLIFLIYCSCKRLSRGLHGRHRMKHCYISNGFVQIHV